jgi:hypothetical protein
MMPRRMSYAARFVQALASSGDGLSGNIRQDVLGASTAPPAYLVESAEGITTYPGFRGDDASIKAREWLVTRLADQGARYH